MAVYKPPPPTPPPPSAPPPGKLPPPILPPPPPPPAIRPQYSYRRPKGVYARPAMDWFAADLCVASTKFIPAKTTTATWVALYNNDTLGRQLHVYGMSLGPNDTNCFQLWAMQGQPASGVDAIGNTIVGQTSRVNFTLATPPGLVTGAIAPAPAGSFNVSAMGFAGWGQAIFSPGPMFIIPASWTLGVTTWVSTVNPVVPYYTSYNFWYILLPGTN